MRRQRQHINVLLFNIYRNVPRRLNRVRVEADSPFAAYLSYLAYRQYSAYLVVCVHHRHQTGVVTDSALHLLGSYLPAAVNVQQLYLKTLFCELFQRVQYRVVLKRR